MAIVTIESVPSLCVQYKGNFPEATCGMILSCLNSSRTWFRLGVVFKLLCMIKHTHVLTHIKLGFAWP